MKETLHAEAWKGLFEAAFRIKDMAPWEWMVETDLFGIRDGGETCYVSVMGNLGEHLGIAVYRGDEALSRFLEIRDIPEETIMEYPELLLQIPQLQLSFENREDLQEWDRRLIRAMGYRVRGGQAWPLFQSYRPGFMPWRLELDEIPVLTRALEQLEDVAPRARAGAFLLDIEEREDMLVRARTADGVWVDERVPIPTQEPSIIDLRWDGRDMTRLKKTPMAGDSIELDFFMFPGSIGKPSQRPAVAYVLLAVHRKSGMPLFADLLPVEESLEHVFGRIPHSLLARLAAVPMRPKEIRVQNHFLVNLLEPVMKELGTKIVHQSPLKTLRAVKSGLTGIL
ncbi:MAG TPA: hypothetical protein PLQ15_12420 [Syntrophales bacterium]|nr:hypothetical protein [Syntrophobacterales bacterium]HQL91393.1 hypothetical protein [Syntrophales bacterium]